MELFIVIALSANVLLTAVCAYCLSFAVVRNNPDQETAFLKKVEKISRKMIIVGGSTLIAFTIYAVLLLTAMAYS